MGDNGQVVVGNGDSCNLQIIGADRCALAGQMGADVAKVPRRLPRKR